MDDEILSKEEFKILEDEGVLHLSSDGKRNISTPFFSSSPSPPVSPSNGEISGNDEISGDNKISRTATVQYHRTRAPQDVEFPEQVMSLAALEFIGLKHETAKVLWNRWSSRSNPEANPDDLIDYIWSHTCNLRRASWSAYTDKEALEKLGVAQWLQEAILDPTFRDIYLTRSLKGWLDDSLCTNFNSLTRIHKQLKVYATVRGNRKEQRQASLRDTETEVIPFPKPHVCVTTAPPPILPGHEVFYKAKHSDDLIDSDTDPFIGQHGVINMAAIRTYGGGDFNPIAPAWYWTPEHETALAYKKYAEARKPFGEIWIIRIQVPTTFIASLRKKELWYSDDWKAYVWHCRKRHGGASIPEKYHPYWVSVPTQTDLIVGHICKRVETDIPLIPKGEVQSRMSEDNVLSIGDRKASQWVFVHEGVAQRLAREIRGKMHVDVYAFKER